MIGPHVRPCADGADFFWRDRLRLARLTVDEKQRRTNHVQLQYDMGTLESLKKTEVIIDRSRSPSEELLPQDEGRADRRDPEGSGRGGQCRGRLVSGEVQVKFAWFMRLSIAAQILCGLYGAVTADWALVIIATYFGSTMISQERRRLRIEARDEAELAVRLQESEARRSR